MKEGYVYIVSFEDPVLRKLNPYVKIGMSFDAKNRIHCLQTGSPLRLRCFGLIKSEDPKPIEKFLHNLLKKERLSGEWFKISHGLIDAIRTRYRVWQDEMDDLLITADDTPESIRIKELESDVRSLREELFLCRKYAKDLRKDYDICKHYADLWAQDRSKQMEEDEILRGVLARKITIPKW